MIPVKKTNVNWFPSLIDEMLRPDFMGGMQQTSAVPPVNVREDETHFYLDVAVPGRKKEDIRIEVDRNVLTISSEEKMQEETINERFSRREFHYGSFKRAFTLPKTVSDDQIQATYSDGVLTLSLPKKQEALPKPKRTIEIA